MTYHVAKTGKESNSGSATQPFLTISAAAAVATAGDTVIVHQGEYREWVKPKNPGLSHNRRITYKAADGEKVVIKGSERIQTWENVEGSLWRVTLPNSFFGGYNPYVETIYGDWFKWPVNRPVHLGDVYLNGMSFFEAESLDHAKNPKIITEHLDRWTEEIVPVKNPNQTKYLWFSQVDEANTTIYANFHEANPNEACVEINVRKCCFYPEETGRDYITVSGFEMAHAATPWTPPTGDQPGLIGAHWSKGWIIENNIIHDSKCSAVSIGKPAAYGSNYRTSRKDKPGYLYQLETVFAASHAGWSKETIGSHIIRNNIIYNCGQNGIVGHLGCAFSEIYGNHIYNIDMKREFFGSEIGGIKLHGAIDVQIHSNYIHDCSLGIWLDWQIQGTRISKNLLHSNNRDLFIEVTHGPAMIDHNIFGSKYAFDNYAQGTAYIRNLIAGKMIIKKMLNRATPYHIPHSTAIAGIAMVYGYDDRLYQNIFIGSAASANKAAASQNADPEAASGGSNTAELFGTAMYDPATASLEEYIDKIEAMNKATPGDLYLFEMVEQPAYVSDNAYFNNAKAFAKEARKLDTPGFDTEFSIEEDSGAAWLNITLPEGFQSFTSGAHCTNTIPRVRIVDAEYENPDGSKLVLDSDYHGQQLVGEAVAGPIFGLKPGKNRVQVWRPNHVPTPL
ncbi:MAG: right-handed parallel beta-helix repeat-containing protein [Defluviitaleaceae bacterium]|nr:right-handed parallel beta-helix repeat-containing protein [Defluviitaleaceae bacterium]